MISGKIDSIYFMGEYFVGSNAEFEFTLGERIQMLKVAAYVKSVPKEHFTEVHKVNKGCNAKAKASSMKSETSFIPCLNGWLFKKQSNILPSIPYVSTNNQVDCAQLKEDLFKCLVKAIKKHAKQVEWAVLESHIKQDLVSVHIHDNGDIRGSIQCIFCDMEKRKKKTSSVSVKKFASQTGNKIYWVVSNFADHLKKQHSSGKAPQISGKTQSIQHDDKCTATVDTEQQGVEQGNVLHDIQAISHVDDKTLYTQIAEQIQKVSIQALCITQQVMTFNIDSMQRNVKIIPMKPDGSCLYNAIAHQLNPDIDLNSKQFVAIVTKLRQECVTYILDNFEYFRRQLQNTILEREGDEMSDSLLDIKCKNFLKNELPKSTCWGGYESIIAASDLKSVNILIFNENGEVQCGNKFNISYNRSICIAYRLGSTAMYADDEYETIEEITIVDSESEFEVEVEEKQMRDHYDSISFISDQDIYDLSVFISKRNAIGHDRTICLEIEDSTISINEDSNASI